MTTFNKHFTPTAKKEIQCDICGEMIPVGDKYDMMMYMKDGKMYTTKAHIECVKVLNIIDKPFEEMSSIQDVWDAINVYIKEHKIKKTRNFSIFDKVKKIVDHNNTNKEEEL